MKPLTQDEREYSSFFVQIISLALIWLIFLPRIIQGTTSLAGLLEHDIGFQWIPFKEFQGQALREGYFPLWCPYVFAGMPFLAFNHTQCLYPFGFLLSLLDYPSSINFYYPIHLSIAFLGFYYLLRARKISPLPAGITSLSLVLSGKFFHFMHFLPALSSNVWSGWFFFFLVKLNEKKNFGDFLGLSITIFIQLLGGEVEGTLYQFLFGIFFLFILIFEKGELLAKNSVVILFALLFGLLLCLVQLLPSLEYSRYFLRSIPFSFDAYRLRLLPASKAWSLLFPLKEEALTSSRELAQLQIPAPYFYLGLIPIFFAIFATLKRLSSFFLFLTSLLSLAIFFGNIRLLDLLLYNLPLFNKLSAQEHIFYLFQIFLFLCAGEGLEILWRGGSRNVLFYFGIFSLSLIIFGEVIFETFWLSPILLTLSSALILMRIIPGLRNLYSSRNFKFAVLVVLFLTDTYWLSFSTLPNNNRSLYRLPEEIIEIKRNLSGTAGRFIAVSRRGLNDPLLLYHLGLRVGFGTIDSWITVAPLRYVKFLNLIDPRAVKITNNKIDKLGYNVELRDAKFIDAENFHLINLLSLRYIINRGLNLKFSSPYSISKLESGSRGSYNRNLSLVCPEKKSYKIYIQNEDHFLTKLRPLSKDNLSFLIKVSDGTDSHILYSRTISSKTGEKSLNLKLSHLAPKKVQLEFHTIPLSTGCSGLELFEPQIINITKPIQLVYEKNDIELYLNRDAFPQAFVIHNLEVHKDDDILERLRDAKQKELKEKAFFSALPEGHKVVEMVSEELKQKNILSESLPEQIKLVSEHPDRMLFQAQLIFPGYLFLNHQYLPGWRVFVDGKEWKIEEANYCFRAVFLEKGEHKVEFRYEPLSFATGLYFSLGAVMSLVLSTIFFVGKKAKKFINI